MNIALNRDWARFKAHLIRTLGREGAAHWATHMAAVMEREARIHAKPIDAALIDRARDHLERGT